MCGIWHIYECYMSPAATRTRYISFIHMNDICTIHIIYVYVWYMSHIWVPCVTCRDSHSIYIIHKNEWYLYHKYRLYTCVVYVTYMSAMRHLPRLALDIYHSYIWVIYITYIRYMLFIYMSDIYYIYKRCTY